LKGEKLYFSAGFGTADNRFNGIMAVDQGGDCKSGKEFEQ